MFRSKPPVLISKHEALLFTPLNNTEIKELKKLRDQLHALRMQSKDAQLNKETTKSNPLKLEKAALKKQIDNKKFIVAPKLERIFKDAFPNRNIQCKIDREKSEIALLLSQEDYANVKDITGNTLISTQCSEEIAPDVYSTNMFVSIPANSGDLLIKHLDDKKQRNIPSM
jgi:hypothetical protein